MNNQKGNFSNIIRHFSPAWYASVMGTGGLANVLYLLNGKISFLKPLAVGLWWLNILLFLLMIGPWIARWFLHFDRLLNDLKHPVMSNFFVTMPVGGLILATNFFIIGKDYFSMSFITGLGLFFWVVTVLLALAFGVFVTYNMMVTESIGPELTNFSWYITPVASVVIPLLGNNLVKVYAGRNLPLAKFINLTDLTFYGIGIFLFLILSSILLNRFIYYKMPPGIITPTFWILLGPIGVGTVSLLGMADILKLLGLISAVNSLKILAVILWGFGLWAFILTVVVTIRYMREGGIPFSLSWWAFIFPLSAYTLSSLQVYAFTGVQAIYDYTIVLTLLLVILWVSTFVRSVVGTFNRKLLIPPAPGNKKSR